MTAHTPAPWGAVGEYDIITMTGRRLSLATVKGGKYIGHSTQEANAILIAAAPRLYELALAFVSYLEDDSRSPRRRQACLTHARAAVAVATNPED